MYRLGKSVKNETTKGYRIRVYRADGCNGQRGFSPDPALTSFLGTEVETEGVNVKRKDLEYRGWIGVILRDWIGVIL